MKKTVYYCDNCKKIIGERKHISLQVHDRFSGIAVPSKSLKKSFSTDPQNNEFSNNWTVKELEDKFIHFCKGECIGKYFDKLIEK